jgi:Ger(x)C family germination protein
LKDGPADSSKDVRSESADTVSGAVRAIDDSISQRLDFGQARILLLGQSLLDDEHLLRQAIDACERNSELNRKIYVLAAEGGAKEILEKELKGEPAAGVFVQTYYKNGEGIQQNLESFISELRGSSDALLPEIRLLEKEEDSFTLEISGASVISGFKRDGSLSVDLARGFMWAKESCSGIEVAVSHDGARVPMRITQSKPKAFFEEASDGTLLCHVSVEAKGVIEEFNFDGKSLSDNEKLETLSALYKEAIRHEILDTFRELKERESDAYGFGELLRKKSPALHKVRKDDWKKHFASMNILPAVDVDIISAGAVK